MNRPERFETNYVEVCSTPEGQEMQAAGQIAKAEGIKTLHEQHPDKPYHGPGHSVHEGPRESMQSVTGRGMVLMKMLRESLAQSLAIATAEQPDKMALFTTGVEVGLVWHDSVIRFTVDENGKVNRLRGEKAPGGNEYDSFKQAEAALLAACEDKDNPLLPEMVRVMRQTIEGTYPTFAMAEFDSALVKTFPENVQSALASGEREDGTPVFKGIRLDSDYAKTSLAGLIGSTADLGDAFTSKRFQKTGNQELFEGDVRLTNDCLTYSEGAAIPRARGKAILDQLKDWRKAQVGVAFGQKVRHMENFTPENISRLVAEEVGQEPAPTEIEHFIETMRSVIENIDTTVMDAADLYERYVATFDSIPAYGEETFNESERETFLDALEFMNFEPGEMAAYLEDVEVAQERPLADFKLAA